MAESIALACLVRGQATAEDLRALSDALPDEIRVREADKPREDQKSFTTGAYIHGDQVGVRRNVRMFPLSTRLLAEIMRSNFSGRVFSSLAFFRQVQQPPHKDTTNGPHDNLLLACSSFGNGGLWTEAKGGMVSRMIRGREVEGEILSWKDGKISFDAHRWHATEDWSGFRLVLAGYTVAELGSLAVRDIALLEDMGFCLREARTPEAATCTRADKVDPVHPPVTGGEGPSRICREPWGSRPFHDGAGLCSPGRWDPSQRLYCEGAGWSELRAKLEEIVMGHAGGPIPFDRVVFEMATKGEAGCSLVSDLVLHAAIRSAMIEHLGAKGWEIGDLDEISPGQPFRLRLMSALLRDAGDPDWQVLLDAQHGLPVGIKNPLPRTPEVYEEQTSWKLEMGPADVAKAWRANYESAAEHVDYVREHFDAEVSEGLMLKLDEDAFWGKYGDEAALSAIAVLVDEGPPQKKRVIHDASHEVMLNHRVKCLDKVRSPGAREKRYLLRFLKDHRCAALSVTGDISKAHRRFRHSPDEWGYLGCKASDADAFVYVNCVGTFGVASAGYWWSRISGGGIRLMHHVTGRRFLELLLYADDLEAIAGDRAGRRGIVISYAALAALGFPFKWAKTCGGFVVEWVGFETAYSSFKLGLSRRRAEWLTRWCMEVSASGRTTWSDFSCALGRLGFGANALSWERPFLGPMYSWSATRGKHGSLTVPVMIRVILRWLAERFQEGGRLQEPMTLTGCPGRWNSHFSRMRRRRMARPTSVATSGTGTKCCLGTRLRSCRLGLPGPSLRMILREPLRAWNCWALSSA